MNSLWRTLGATGALLLASLIPMVAYGDDVDDMVSDMSHDAYTPKVEALIDSTPGAAAVFRATPGGAVHIPTGATCIFGGRAELQLVKVDVLSDGQSASCSYAMPNGHTTLFVMRLTAQNISQFETDNIAAFEKDHPNAVRIEDPVQVYSDAMSPPFVRSYKTRNAQGDAVTSIWMGDARGWAVSVYTSNSPETHKDSDAMAAIVWMIGGKTAFRGH